MTEATPEVVNDTPIAELNALSSEPVPEVVAEAPVEQVAEEETPAPEPQETPEQEDKRKNPWFLKRISETTERARIAEEKAANLEAMLERVQKNPDQTQAPVPTAGTPEWQTAVQREAARLRLQDDSTAIRDAGFKDYGQSFGQSLAILNAAGAVSDDIVLDLIAVDKANAHKILATLADDPDRAAALSSMDSRRRVAELTRISDRMATPTTTATPTLKAAPAKTVSKAPAPPPPIEPSATKIKNWRADDASEEEFQRGWEARMKERGVGRR
jgi:hypothetical protein